MVLPEAMFVICAVHRRIFMNRRLISVALAVVFAVSLSAQQAAPAPAPATPGAKVVATVNGESITAAQLDRLWNRMGAKMRGQYEQGGNGKMRFLENYVGKRLLLQLAAQSEFEKSPSVQAELEAAKEAALFDLYVRDVVATQVVTDSAVRKFYDDHPADFLRPQQARVRMIFVGRDRHTVEEGRQLIGDVMKEMYGVKTRSGNDPQAIVQAFAAAAARTSEHSSATSGGDLGWVAPGTLDPKLNDAVFAMKPNMVSGILETDAGTYLLLIQDQQPATPEPFESVRAAIRDYLFSANVQKVMEAVTRTTNELRATSKVTLHPENVQ
jgi:peptidyl-prolyl cis-trans isomerase C